MLLKPKSIKILKWLCAVFLLGILLLSVALIDKPPLLEQYDFGTAITCRNGNVIRLQTAKDDQYRFFAPLSHISPHVIKSTILYEDRYFWHHPGVNLVALVKAFGDTYILGNKRRGASTITMQLARMHFNIHSRHPVGKLKQLFYALKLELHYSKKEILEAYLNLAPYGGNIQGIKAASLIYFNRTPSELSLAQAMTLSVIPQNPGKRKPVLPDQTQTTLAKSSQIHSTVVADAQESTELWEARRRLSQKLLKENPKQDISQLGLSRPLTMTRVSDIPFWAPHFTTTLLLRNQLNGNATTTLDLKLQRMIKRHIRSYVERNRSTGINNAAALLLNHQTMEVLAQVGSADFFDNSIHGQVNAATARRSPGSTLKPFVYAMAIDQGLIHPGTLLKDAPVSFSNYTPQNFDGEFKGPLTATQALVRSRNIPALVLASKLKGDGLYGFLKKTGVGKLREKQEYGLVPVLGGVEVTMEELVQFYALLANGGILKPLKHLSNQQSPKNETRLISKEACFLTLKMLTQNPRPGQQFKNTWILKSDSPAWKTGTSPGARDAWSVGVFGPYVLAVWVGQFSGGGSPIYEGRKSAAPLFFEMVDSLKHTYEPKQTAEKLHIETVDVCSVSGMIPNKFCPHTAKTGFIPGISPIKKCNIHHQIAINKHTGLRSCDAADPSAQKVVFEYWPSDLAKLFKDAGLPKKTPPAYEDGCETTQKQSTSTTLAITSPKKNVVYTIRADRIEKEKIPLRAVSDGDAEKLFWFLDTKPIGNIRPGKTLFLSPQPGIFDVRVVDDKGRSHSRKLKVEVIE